MAPATSTARKADLIDTFRRPDFNVAAFVRDVTSEGSDSAARLTQRLEDCASEVDEELRRKIAACHEELLQNAGKVNDLDGDLGSVREVVESLKGMVARVKGDVSTPFECVKKNVQLLARVQAVNVLIRKLARFLFDARKLRTQMEAPTKDYSKAAHTLNELESVLQENSIERVDVLRGEVVWIRETGAKVRRQAEEDLRTGVRQGNQISLSVALQVFFNLQCLWPQLQRVLAELLEEFSQAPLAGGAGFQQSLEVNLQVLIAHVQRIHLLDELIRSKTDALTHKAFSAALEQEGVSSLTSHFWSEATKRFAAKFARLTQDRAGRRALVEGFPKTLHALTEAMDKVSLSSRGRGQIFRAAEREALYGVVAELRNEFLAESIRRVTEPVEMMLPDKLLASIAAASDHPERQLAGAPDAGGHSDDLPTSHDLRRYVQLLVAELERNECCADHLLKDAVRNVRSSVLLFATRLEQIIDSSCLELRVFEDEASLRLRSPLPMPAAGHARNARIFGIAHHTLLVLKETIPSRFQAAIMAQQVQNTLQQTQAAIVAPMMEFLQRLVRGATTQLAPGAAGARTADGAAGLVALSQICAHVSRYYFSLFGAGQLLSYLKDFCAFLIRSFLTSAVLPKPLDDAAKAVIAQDMQQVELVLSALDSEFQTHVRHEIGIFNEFRRMLFMPQLGAAELDEFANAIPLPLLLVYLVHQLPPEVPSLPDFYGASSAAAFAEGTLLPLWEEEPTALAALKAKVDALNTQYGINRCVDPVANFLKARVK